MVVSRSIIFGAKSKIAFAITALTAGAGGAAVATSEDPATSLKLCTTVPLRLFRVSLTAASIAFGILFGMGHMPLVPPSLSPPMATVHWTLEYRVWWHIPCASPMWHAYLASTGIASGMHTWHELASPDASGMPRYQKLCE
nr:putative ABC1 protein At2g40090 [Tanacetum cinerariifolium]